MSDMANQLTAGGSTRAGRFGWAMFDWANQPYFTVVTTFIFAPYFTSHVVGDPILGQSYWGYTQAAAGIVIAVLAPFLGAIADAGGPRKPWITIFAAVCVLGSAGLWFATPAADTTLIVTIMVLVVVGTIGIEFSIVFNNAMLPSLVGDDKMGNLSGFAWGLGYIGGLIALFVVLAGFSLPEVPLFGLDKVAHEHDRMVGPMSAIWFALFILPMLIYTPDISTTGLDRRAAIGQGISNLLGTLRRLPRYRNVALYLVSRMIYYDGQSAIFAFGGVYAAGIFGWGTTELGLFGIIILVFAAIGCFGGGWLDDRIGSKPTIVVAVSGLFFCTLAVVSIGDGQALFFFTVSMPTAEGALFSSTAERIFLAVSILLGIFGGPAQSASRTLLARLVPRQSAGRFFGLYALSGKATSFMAPLAIGIMTAMFDSQRVGIAIILVFLGVGLLLFLGVREERTEEPD
jgi:UMF1 family MFS transporter